jgi:hypothetical protein
MNAHHREPQTFADEQIGASTDLDPVRDRKPLASGVLISCVIHAIVLFLFSLVVLVAQSLEEEAAPIRVTQIDAPPPPPEQPKLERDVLPSEVAITIESENEAEINHPGPLSQLDVPIEDAAQREEDNDSSIAKGREEAVADGEMGGQGAFMAIGAGGGSSGMFGSRSGGGKKRALGKFGGSKASESSVDAALRWFKKHQEPDGRWDPLSYHNNCTENPKCEPAVYNTNWSRADYGTTALVVLCYLGAGYDQRMPSKYRDTVRKCLDNIVKNQQADGCWKDQPAGTAYSLALCTMALSEAYAMSGDPSLKVPTQRGIDAILGRQMRDEKSQYPLGWSYNHPAAGTPTGGITNHSRRCDASITPWMAMSLKSARAAGFDVKDGMDGVARWLELAWKYSNPDWQKLVDPYQDESTIYYDFDYLDGHSVYGGATEESGCQIGRLSSAGALCAIFTGRKQGDIMLETLLNYGMNHQFPDAYTPNMYYFYYNTLAMFQAGGERWRKWNESMRDLLVKNQRVGNGCFDGSWDHRPAIPGKRSVTENYGRPIQTALACLSLEVYYRYLPVAVRDHK